MDLFPLNAIDVDSANQALISDLDHLKSEIDRCRPLDAPTLRRIGNELLGDQIHESAAIEGNPLTLRETLVVLETGQMIDVGRKRESQEVLNLRSALDEIHAVTNSGSSAVADEQFFLSVHRRLFAALRDDIAGQYRQVRVTIRGAKHQPPREPGELMSTVFSQLAESNATHSAVAATWTHWAITRIHPFVDGNGRMARLWQDHILLADHHTPAVIPASHRKTYYAALQSADDGNFSELLQLVIQSAVATSQLYVNAIRESDSVADWAAALVGEADQRAGDRLRLEYSRWQSRVLELRDAFSRCVTLLNRKSSGLEFEFVSYPLIDQSTWDGLRSEPRASRTWLFRLIGRSAAGRFQHVFFAGKHFRDDVDDGLGLLGQHVCIIVSEKRGEHESFILDDDNSAVTLREVLVHNNQFLRKRWDASSRETIWDRDVAALQIAQDFLSEVVRHCLTP